MLRINHYHYWCECRVYDAQHIKSVSIDCDCASSLLHASLKVKAIKGADVVPRVEIISQLYLQSYTYKLSAMK